MNAFIKMIAATWKMSIIGAIVVLGLGALLRQHIVPDLPVWYILVLWPAVWVIGTWIGYIARQIQQGGRRGITVRVMIQKTDGQDEWVCDINRYGDKRTIRARTKEGMLELMSAEDRAIVEPHLAVYEKAIAEAEAAKDAEN
jgi:hypothetical protein